MSARRRERDEPSVKAHGHCDPHCISYLLALQTSLHARLHVKDAWSLIATTGSCLPNALRLSPALKGFHAAASVPQFLLAHQRL